MLIQMLSLCKPFLQMKTASSPLAFLERGYSKYAALDLDPGYRARKALAILFSEPKRKT